LIQEDQTLAEYEREGARLTRSIEAQMQEMQRQEAQRQVVQRQEAQRLEAQRLEAQRLEAQRLEAQRLEAQRLEAQELEAQRRVRDADAAREPSRLRNQERNIQVRARQSAILLQLLADNSNPNVMVEDTDGLGTRGYIHDGINQPYAKNIALELERQKVAGNFYQPNMDSNANKFLAQALPHLRSHVFGPNPTAHGSSAMIVNDVIKALKKMN